MSHSLHLLLRILNLIVSLSLSELALEISYLRLKILSLAFFEFLHALVGPAVKLTLLLPSS